MRLLYPGFLWGLLAIGIPVVIHLLQMRRPQRVLFTNTGFIREVELTTMRRRRLQEWLVLLTRVLAIVFLVLLFCQPFLPKAQQPLAVNTGAVKMAIDNSGSMQAAGYTQPQLLQEAVASATALSRSYGTGTHFQLIGQPGTGTSTGETGFQDILNTRLQTDRQTGWGSTSVRDAWQEPNGSLFLFSDFQKNEVSPQALRQLNARGEVVLVPLAAKPTGNIYVDSVWLNDAFIRTHTNLALHVKLQNGGKEAVRECPVKVLLGKQQVATFRVSVGVGQSSETTVQVQLQDASLVQGQVITGDTPVTFDNAYYFTLQPASVVNILEIGDKPTTKSAYASEPLFSYRFFQPQNVDYALLGHANLVLVKELARIEPGLRDVLAAATKRGASVVVIPTSNPAAHSSYHELFRALGVGGEQWESSAGIPVRQEVVMPNSRNSFFKDVFGAQPQRVALPQVAPVLQMRQAGTDILRLRDGSSYLTQFASAMGQVYVFAAPFAKDYTDFTTHALFVPVLYRLAMLSYHADQQPAYRLGTTTLSLSVPVTTERAASDEASYRLVHDSLTYIPAQRVQNGQLQLEIPAGLNAAGFYQLKRQGKIITTLAFNNRKQESELAAYSVAELRQLIGPNQPTVRVLDMGAQPEALTRYRNEQTGTPLWRYCLLLVLACLLAEAFILRFGRQRGVGTRMAT